MTIVVAWPSVVLPYDIVVNIVPCIVHRSSMLVSPVVVGVAAYNRTNTVAVVVVVTVAVKRKKQRKNDCYCGWAQSVLPT